MTGSKCEKVEESLYFKPETNSTFKITKYFFRMQSPSFPRKIVRCADINCSSLFSSVRKKEEAAKVKNDVRKFQRLQEPFSFSLGLAVVMDLNLRQFCLAEIHGMVHIWDHNDSGDADEKK